jgi:MFS family permease
VGVLLAAADTYVVVLVLPNIMASVGLGLGQLQRATPIVSGFLLGYVVVLPLIGRTSDLYGRVPVLVFCLSAFGFGSIVTATSNSLTAVIIGRAVQGVGGGGLVPVTLALVADHWTAERRALPLGVVGGVQETGSILGPLYGAGLVVLAGWRSIFWVNAATALVLGVALSGMARRAVGRRGATRLSTAPAATHVPGPSPLPTPRDRLGLALLTLTCVAVVLTVVAPAQLADNVTIGRVYGPLVGAGGAATWTEPIVILTVVLLVAFVVRSLRPPIGRVPVLALSQLPEMARQADVVGSALLAGAFATVIVSFASADPSHQVVAQSAPIMLSVGAVCLVLFFLRERRAAQPLIEFGAFSAPSAWGALGASLFLGGALMVVLVDVPIFARATIYPSSELGAALELVRFLVGVPVGAVAGGALARSLPYRVVAGLGLFLSGVTLLLMGTWGERSLAAHLSLWGWHAPLGGSDVALVVCGLGFGLTVSPINSALLGHVPETIHGLGASLIVVARTLGMLVGLAALTGIGLRRFYEDVNRIGSPVHLCPAHPAHCPVYTHAVSRALLSELHVIFAGAAGCALVAAFFCLVTLARSPQATPSALVVLRSAGNVSARSGEWVEHEVRP